MKKYVKQLPLILFPYAYLIYLLCAVTIDALSDAMVALLPAAAAVFSVLTLIIVITNIVSAATGRYTAYEAAKINLTVKCWQIPAYIFHFLMGAAGFLMSVWGIGFLMLSIIIDVVTIALTGLNAVSCTAAMKKEDIISLRKAAVYTICSFIFVIDIITAINCVRKCRAKMQ